MERTKTEIRDILVVTNHLLWQAYRQMDMLSGDHEKARYWIDKLYELQHFFINDFNKEIFDQP